MSKEMQPGDVSDDWQVTGENPGESVPFVAVPPTKKYLQKIEEGVLIKIGELRSSKAAHHGLVVIAAVAGGAAVIGLVMEGVKHIKHAQDKAGKQKLNELDGNPPI